MQTLTMPEFELSGETDSSTPTMHRRPVAAHPRLVLRRQRLVLARGRLRARPSAGSARQPRSRTFHTPAAEMSWDGADPDGKPLAGLDAEIGAAAKSLFFAGDLIRPGPGLLPFGAKARDRRERRLEVDAIAATRRTELGERLAARRDRRVQRSVAARRHGHPRIVAALLTGLVVAVAAVG